MTRTKTTVSLRDSPVLETRERSVTVSKPDTPREGTIEYLFKDYSGERFKTKLTNPIQPVGEEQW
jgi:hypothetical protein